MKNGQARGIWRKASACPVLVWLALSSAPASAVGVITGTWGMVDKTVGGPLVMVGRAQVNMFVDFDALATCSCNCAGTALEYGWDFGDGYFSPYPSTSHRYTSGGDYLAGLSIVCPCGATQYVPGVHIYVVSGLVLNQIGDIANPGPTGGRFCFNDERRVEAHALPSAVSAQATNRIDWKVIVNSCPLVLLNAGTGTPIPSIPALPVANWPTQNDEWGLKTLTIGIDNSSIATSEDGELNLTGPASDVSGTCPAYAFFERDNHQNPGADDPPNWFYYWSDTDAGVIGCVYEDTGVSYTDLYFLPHTAHIGNDAIDTDFQPPAPGQNSADALDGIDTFAYTCRHEDRHKGLLDIFWPAPSGYDALYDDDGDTLPSQWEITNPYDGGPYSWVLPDSNWGDEHGGTHADAERFTCITQASWAVGSANDHDWARPGHQWDVPP